MIPAPRTDKAKVFIVDDSQVVVERLSLMLDELKYINVAGHAGDINTALATINKIQPDAAILDIHLKDDAPAANGMDLLAILRKTYPFMLIIMFSNLAHPMYVDKCMELGADYFFDKSSDCDKIIGVLKNVFGSK
jgi:DNA-binding NarL/FixJ family response regulator